jgi:hypothetical protein
MILLFECLSIRCPYKKTLHNCKDPSTIKVLDGIVTHCQVESCIIIILPKSSFDYIVSKKFDFWNVYFFHSQVSVFCLEERLKFFIVFQYIERKWDSLSLQAIKIFFRVPAQNDYEEFGDNNKGGFYPK